jgi:hypothetical protein
MRKLGNNNGDVLKKSPGAGLRNLDFLRKAEIGSVSIDEEKLEISGR